MMIRSVNDLGALVQTRRKKLGWTQQKLADEVGVRPLWVSQMEQGKTTAQIGLVLRTLRVLNLKLNTVSADPSSKHNGINLDDLVENG